ncbi:MAG TPA: hypothetical protein PKH77_05550 [Anaerolineae bacterium]|nr:hypothetical protein [Anaerolineae bacterium]
MQDNGAPANGYYDFRFTLYDVMTGSVPLTGTTSLTLTAVSVTQGQFTVQLDFGNSFGNQQLYLEIAVRPGSNNDALTTLTPRQAITPVPYARYALRSGSADTAASVPWDGVSDKPANLNWRSLYVPAAAMNYTLNSLAAETHPTGCWHTIARYWKYSFPMRENAIVCQKCLVLWDYPTDF